MPQQLLDARIARAHGEADARAEREAGHPQRNAGVALRKDLEGGEGVVLLAGAAVVAAGRRADAAEVEAQHGDAGVAEGLGGAVDDVARYVPPPSGCGWQTTAAATGAAGSLRIASSCPCGTGIARRPEGEGDAGSDMTISLRRSGRPRRAACRCRRGRSRPVRCTSAARSRWPWARAARS